MWKGACRGECPPQEKSLNHPAAALQRRCCDSPHVSPGWHVRGTRSCCGHQEWMQKLGREVVGVGKESHQGWEDEHQNAVTKACPN